MCATREYSIDCPEPSRAPNRLQMSLAMAADLAGTADLAGAQVANPQRLRDAVVESTIYLGVGWVGKANKYTGREAKWHKAKQNEDGRRCMQKGRKPYIVTSLIDSEAESRIDIDSDIDRRSLLNNPQLNWGV